MQAIPLTLISSTPPSRITCASIALVDNVNYVIGMQPGMDSIEVETPFWSVLRLVHIRTTGLPKNGPKNMMVEARLRDGSWSVLSRWTREQSTNNNVDTNDLTTTHSIKDTIDTTRWRLTILDNYGGCFKLLSYIRFEGFASGQSDIEEADAQILQLLEKSSALRSQRQALLEASSDEHLNQRYAPKGDFYWESWLRPSGKRLTPAEMHKESQTFASEVFGPGVNIFVISAPGAPPARWTALTRRLRAKQIPCSALYEEAVSDWKFHFGLGVRGCMDKKLRPVVLHEDSIESFTEELGERSLGNAQRKEVQFGGMVLQNYPAEQAFRHMTCADFFFEFLGGDGLLEEAKAKLVAHVLGDPDEDARDMAENVHLAKSLREHRDKGAEFLKVVRAHVTWCSAAAEEKKNEAEHSRLAAAEHRRQADLKDSECKSSLRKSQEIAMVGKKVQELIA